MTALWPIFRLPLMHALGWSLLHFFWQGTVVAILVAGVLGLLRGRSPQLRYVASLCALAGMLLLLIVTFARLTAAGQIVEPRVSIANLDHGSVLDVDTGVGSTQPWLDRMAAQLDQYLPWFLSIWFAGVILLLSRLNLGLIGARRLKSVATEAVPAELRSTLQQLVCRLGVTRPVKLASSALVQVPIVVGWLRPVILIPVGCLMGLSAGQVEAVLAHELAHIRRHDYLAGVFQSVVECLLFYHPAVWWVSKQIRREREHCCDDMAVRVCGDSLGYAKALSFLEERRASLPTVALGANGGVLTMRIKRLLGCEASPAVSRLAAITVAAAILAGAACFVDVVAHAGGQSASAESSQNLSAKYRQWLNEDVVWIITPEERATFLQLKSDSERDKFMNQFWVRRSPTPNSAENAAKDEHYRRIKFANEHFMTGGTPGWKTDRGRVWIVYGPPDEIEAHPSPSPTGLTKPTEFWRYYSIREHGVDRKNVDMTFVDAGGHGDYQLVLSPVNPANN